MPPKSGKGKKRPNLLKATTSRVVFTNPGQALTPEEELLKADAILAFDPLSIYPEIVRKRPYRIYGDPWIILEWRFRPTCRGRVKGQINIHEFYYPMEQLMRWWIEGIPEFIDVSRRQPKIVHDWSKGLTRRYWRIKVPYRRLFLKSRNIYELGDRVQELANMVYERQNTIELDRPKLRVKYLAENRKVIKMAAELMVKVDRVRKREQFYDQTLEILDLEAVGIKQYVLLELAKKSEQTLHMSPAWATYNPAPIEETADEARYLIPSAIQGVPDPRIQQQLEADPTLPPTFFGVDKIETLGLGADIIRLRMLHCTVDSIADQLGIEPKEIARWIAQYRSLPTEHRMKYHQRDAFATQHRLQEHANKVYQDLDNLLHADAEEFASQVKEGSDFGSKKVDIDEVILSYLQEVKMTIESASDLVETHLRKDKDAHFSSLVVTFLDSIDLKRKIAAMQKLQEHRQAVDLIRQAL
jgi:hypothetical protein